MSQDNKRNFILHGSILAMAGIFVRIIGMVYRIPVLNIIGSEGNGIYVTAYNVYNIILVLSSYGLPMAVSKLISARFTKRRYKNAAKVLRCSLTVGAFTGGVAALLVYFGADFIENVIYGGGVPGLAIPLRVLAPTIFIVALLGVLRGFFQGQGTMIPTAVSQIIEQLVNAAHKYWKYEYKRYKQYQLSKAGHNKADLCLSQCHKTLLTAYLKAQ